VTYPTPSVNGRPVYASTPDLTVTVNGTPLDVIEGPRPAGFAHLDCRYVRFAFSGPVTIDVTKRNGTIAKYSISPLKAAIRSRLSGSRLSFFLDAPQYLIVKIDYTKLLILDDPLEVDPPALGQPGVIDVRDSVENPESDSTAAIQAAIDRAGAIPGGGTAYFRAGLYRSSTLKLRSNVTLYLEGGAVIQGVTDGNAYLATNLGTVANVPVGVGVGGRSQTTRLIALIHSAKQSHVAITGRGIIDMNGFAIAGNGGNRIASTAIYVDGGDHIVISGILDRGARYWTNMVKSATNVTIDRLKVVQFEGEEVNDALDICNSSYVSVTNGFALAGDDAYSTKSLGSRAETTHDVTFSNNLVFSGFGGYKIGGGVYTHMYNIVFEKSTLVQTSTLLIAHLYGAATAENITFRDIDVEELNSDLSQRNRLRPIDFQVVFDPQVKGGGPVRNVNVVNVTFRSFGPPDKFSKSVIAGIASGRISDVTFAGLRIAGKAIGSLSEGKIEAKAYASDIRFQR
jgi:hypothetical protein